MQSHRSRDEHPEGANSNVQVERLVLAITQVAGATVAIREHGDERTLRTARAANVPFVTAATSVDGRVVKTLGEGILLCFPAARARDAVSALRSARDQASVIWKQLDPRCDVQVKMTIGDVLTGAVGAAADRRFDVYGRTLHELFKAPATEFVLLPELAELVRR
jgi:class 3 adenylate cyclase